MLENAIENFDQYAPYLSEKTKEGLASLVLENMIPSGALLKNLALRDTGKISTEEFMQREYERILNDKDVNTSYSLNINR